MNRLWFIGLDIVLQRQSLNSIMISAVILVNDVACGTRRAEMNLVERRRARSR